MAQNSVAHSLVGCAPDSHGLCASLASRASLGTESNSQKQRESKTQTLLVSAWPRERVAWRVGGLVRWDPLLLRYGKIGEEPNHRRIERCSREKSPEAHWGFDPPDRPGCVSCVWHSLFQRLPIRSESARGLVSVADGFAWRSVQVRQLVRVCSVWVCASVSQRRMRGVGRSGSVRGRSVRCAITAQPRSPHPVFKLDWCGNSPSRHPSSAPTLAHPHHSSTQPNPPHPHPFRPPSTHPFPSLAHTLIPRPIWLILPVVYVCHHD